MGYPPNPGPPVRAATLTALHYLHTTTPDTAPYTLTAIHYTATRLTMYGRDRLTPVAIGYSLRLLMRSGHIAKTWTPDGHHPLYELTEYGHQATTPRPVGPVEKHGTAPL